MTFAVLFRPVRRTWWKVFQLTLMANWRCWEPLLGQRTGQLNSGYCTLECEPCLVVKQLLQMSKFQTCSFWCCCHGLCLWWRFSGRSYTFCGWELQALQDIIEVTFDPTSAHKLVGSRSQLYSSAPPLTHKESTQLVGTCWNIIGKWCEYMSWLSCGFVWK